jgi:hypothetical protein
MGAVIMVVFKMRASHIRLAGHHCITVGFSIARGLNVVSFNGHVLLAVTVFDC